MRCISRTPHRFACITHMDKQSDNAFGVHAWALMIIFENNLGDETEDDSFFCYWQPPNGKKMEFFQDL